jgi:cell division protein FtsL
MSVLTRVSVPLLWCLLLLSAIGVVWSRHETRNLFIQLQGLHAERDGLDIAWGQLKIEQSWWASHGRVEQTARSGLKMVIPRPDEVRLVNSSPPAPPRRP